MILLMNDIKITQQQFVDMVNRVVKKIDDVMHNHGSDYHLIISLNNNRYTVDHWHRFIEPLLIASNDNNSSPFLAINAFDLAVCDVNNHSEALQCEIVDTVNNEYLQYMDTIEVV